MSAFVLTPFQLPTSRHRHLRMNLRSNRYNPAFRRFKPRPATPPGGNGSSPTPPPPPAHTNGAPIANGTPAEATILEMKSTIHDSPPPASPPPPADDRPEREPDSADTPTLLYEKENPVRWPALHNRLLANPRLPLQLAVELTVGFISKTLAEVQDRGTNFFRQFDHYLCNLSLELFGDAMLVWLLCPVAGGTARLPKHFLQIGSFSARQRLGGFLAKGLQFGAVGVLSSGIGQGVTRVLVKARGGDVAELPRVWPNCLAWGGFLMLSSNSRYQLINGLEQRVLEKRLPGGWVGAGLTFALRFGNCYLGGVQWLPWARFLGVQ